MGAITEMVSHMVCVCAILCYVRHKYATAYSHVNGSDMWCIPDDL